MSPGKPKPIPTFFKTQREFRTWLKKHHKTSEGVWIGFWKKASGKIGMNYAEALDEALSYGWIDSQLQTYDENAFQRRFTPRKSKSVWSKVNREHVARLIKQKRMMNAGLAQVEAAKKDGRWAAAYDSSSTMQMPEDFLKALKNNKKAAEFYKTLNKSNTYSIAWRLHHIKKIENRKRRVQQFVDMLEAGKKPHLI